MKHNEHYVKFDGKEYTKTDDISLTSNDELIDRFNEIVQTNNLSDKISKDLIKRGCKFVGSTIIYSYLQAIGIIYSHDKECFMYKKQ